MKQSAVKHMVILKILFNGQINIVLRIVPQIKNFKIKFLFNNGIFYKS